MYVQRSLSVAFGQFHSALGVGSNRTKKARVEAISYFL